MGYQGVIISDYLDMQALTQHYSLGEAAVLAIEAGVDLLLVSYKPEQQAEIYSALQAALASGRLSPERIEASIQRIERLTQSFPSQALTKPVPDYLQHQALAKTIAEKGTSLISNQSILPLSLATKVTVIYPKVTGFGLEPGLSDVIAATGLGNTALEVSVEPSDAEIAEAVAFSQAAEVLILGIYYWQGNFSAQTSKLYAQLKALDKPVILVSLGNPDILTNLSSSPNAYLATYGFRESNLTALTAILLGKEVASGKLPVAITLP
jgi:beta-N-acetylhexosaminidase